MNAATIIIASYQHAQYLSAAIDSALAQTVPCEVLVVDDGSTDNTFGLLARYHGRIRSVFQMHAGVAKARNHGLDLASGAYVCFLDADDILYPHAVAVRLEAVKQSIVDWALVDWVFADIKIIDDISKQTELSSKRYDYAGKGFPGRHTLQPYIHEANFIPVHAPLIRRSAIGSIRFPEGELEDWAFWKELARGGRVQYVDSVIGEYRKKRSGRNQAK